ncbi:hypothetical protein [Dietzia sp. 179-F 9C3 NHS]|uniref:hypothetical protein n=1 Tax=Dietzia sp. 179-F 9C3 NHS TaxID=3374295 RepID=UPI0038792467
MSAMFDPTVPALMWCFVGWAIAAVLGALVTAHVRHKLDLTLWVGLCAFAAIIVFVIVSATHSHGGDVAVFTVLIAGAVGTASMGVGATLAGGEIARKLA